MRLDQVHMKVLNRHCLKYTKLLEASESYGIAILSDATTIATRQQQPHHHHQPVASLSPLQQKMNPSQKAKIGQLFIAWAIDLLYINLLYE